MPVFQIPISKPKPYRTAEDRIKERKRRDAEDRETEKSGARLPLRGKLSRFASRPLKSDTSRVSGPSVMTTHKRVNPDRFIRPTWRKSDVIQKSTPRKLQPKIQTYRLDQAKLDQAKFTAHLVKKSRSKSYKPAEEFSYPKQTQPKQEIPEKLDRSEEKSTKVVMKIDPHNRVTDTPESRPVLVTTSIGSEREPQVAKGEIAHYNKKNIRTATILPIETPNFQTTMKVTGLTEDELHKALELAATRTKNAALKNAIIASKKSS